MGMGIAKEVAAMQRMTAAELRAKYAEVVGEETRCRHKDYLLRRIAWRFQAKAEDGLSDRARRRAFEHAGEVYRTLSAVAKAISGSHFHVQTGTLWASMSMCW